MFKHVTNSHSFFSQQIVWPSRKQNNNNKIKIKTNKQTNNNKQNKKRRNESNTTIATKQVCRSDKLRDKQLASSY